MALVALSVACQANQPSGQGQHGAARAGGAPADAPSRRRSTRAWLPTATRSTSIYQLFEGLVGFDEQGNVFGVQAQGWQVSEDGRTYTFQLREGPRWSDGKPVTAAGLRVRLEAQHRSEDRLRLRQRPLPDPERRADPHQGRRPGNARRAGGGRPHAGSAARTAGGVLPAAGEHLDALPAAALGDRAVRRPLDRSRQHRDQWPVQAGELAARPGASARPQRRLLGPEADAAAGGLQDLPGRRRKTRW